jgi:diguanylate cyclase (GGDEF)-like protein
MILAVVMVGGECGFELYGFAVLPLIYYSYYVVLITEKRDDIAGRRILAILAVGISIGIKVYSRFVPAVYVLGSASVRYVMYLMNLSIIAVSVMAFQNIYISQIIAMRRTLIRKNVILDNMARTDVLTGLNNRRAVMEFLELPRQVSGTYSVVMADIDDFKKINDTYGHEQGDMVLVRLAEIFRESVRSSDIVCRWGGEEFVVVLMKCGVADAEKIADKIRKGVEKEVFPKIAGKVTMTFGIAGSENIEGEDLLETADKKLYEGKRTGKNCVIL